MKPTVRIVEAEPFAVGDIITYRRSQWTDSRGFMPDGRMVVKCLEPAVRDPRCGSGWSLFGVDAHHFRWATREDVQEAIDEQGSIINRARGMIQGFQAYLDEMDLIEGYEGATEG